MKEIKLLNINESDLLLYESIKVMKKELYNTQQNKLYTDSFIQMNVSNILSIAKKYNYISYDNILTNKGNMYCTIHEINPFIFCELFAYTDGFIHYNEMELFSLFSMFYELKSDKVNSSDMFPKEIIFIQNTLDDISKTELQYQIELTKVSFQTILHTYIYEWMNQCDDEVSCAILLNKIKKETFIGEFIKCCLKIIHICNEIRPICGPELLVKINTGIHKLKKFIISNNSLYL